MEDIHNNIERVIVNSNSNVFPGDEAEQYSVRVVPESTPSTHVDAGKSVIINVAQGKFIDKRVVSQKYYNRLNFNALAQNGRGSAWSIGVTSPNSREGKTLVACNLAVSLSLGAGLKTVLLDLNINNPRVHKIFGIPVNPGLMNALDDESIHVSSTPIERLSVLAAGDYLTSGFGLENLSSLREVLWSLQRSFQFVIVDMPSLASGDLTESIAKQLNGVLIVVDTQKTRRRDVERAFRQLSHEQVLGFIFNRVRDDDF